MQKPTSLKEWTEVWTAWLQIAGLFAAGLWALMEYQERKHDLRVQRSIAYLAKADSESLINARLSLLESEQSQHEKFIRALSDQSLSRDQKNVAYYQFVVDDLVKHNEEPGLKAEFNLLLGFLEEGVICSQEGICDEATVRANLNDFGRSFVREYIPYICYLRQAWRDPSIGRRVEQFFNPSAANTACTSFYLSIGRVAKMNEPKEGL